jgi:serine/threonine-protein kinase
MNLEGKIIGNRYEIIEKVGNGGMATVYKARDTILNRYVAIKVLRDEFTTDEEFIKRFNTEAQSAARLAHANIVSVYDVGQEYNIYYIVMELIQGKTLKQIIAEEGALPWKWSVNIASQICSALDMAHRNGIVHRDIKPHNIIITEDGAAKVTDFGIAKAVSNSTITAFGTTLGSVHYFSPEHARGGYTDAKSDIYSLGVVMYEMVTGRVPFDADTPVSVALKHMQEEPIPPIELNERVPLALNDIILKAMKKDTGLRYSSAAEMLKDLNRVLKDPNGDFVNQKSTDDYTRVIPVVSDDMIEEEITRRRESGSSRTSSRRQQYEEEKTGLERFFEDHPGAKKAAYILVPVIIILLCALIFWGSWKLTTKLLGINSNNTVSATIQLADVTGKTTDEAKQVLDAQKVRYEISEEYNSEVEAGRVISQDPAAGTNYDINKNRPVKLTVSKGIKLVYVPTETTVGKKEDEAKKLIEAAELKVEVKKETSMTVEEGIVLKQEPEPGAKVDAGSVVTLTVSAGTGLEKVSVPYVVDKDIETAKKELTEKKLEVNIIYEENTSKSNGIVLKQSLEVGKVVDEGTAITLTVNKIQEIKEGTVNIHVKSLTGYKEPTTTKTTDSKDDKTENKTDNKTENKNETTGTTPKTVSVRVKVDEESVYNEKVLENTEVVNVTVKGKGTITVKVYIDEVLKDTRQMDLNSDNRVIDVK